MAESRWTASTSPDPRNARPRNSALNSQPLLQLPHTVPRDAQFRPRIVLQPHEDATVHAREQFLDEGCIQNRRAMNPDESTRVQLLLELGERMVDHVLPTGGYRKSQPVLREEMRDP